MTKQAVFDQAKELSKQDQLELAMELWNLADGDGNASEITPDFAAELDRRIAEDNADETPGQGWSVLREQVLRGEM
jgi:putative addiction module component (TIGR02574 family)